MDNTDVSEETALKLLDTIRSGNEMRERLNEETERKDAFGCCRPISSVKSDVLCNLGKLLSVALNSAICCPKFILFMDFYIYTGQEQLRLAVKHGDDLIVSADYRRDDCRAWRFDNVMAHGNSPYIGQAVTRLVSDDFILNLGLAGDICSAVWRSEEEVV